MSDPFGYNSSIITIDEPTTPAAARKVVDPFDIQASNAEVRVILGAALIELDALTKTLQLWQDANVDQTFRWSIELQRDNLETLINEALRGL